MMPGPASFGCRNRPGRKPRGGVPNRVQRAAFEIPHPYPGLGFLRKAARPGYLSKGTLFPNKAPKGKVKLWPDTAFGGAVHTETAFGGRHIPGMPWSHTSWRKSPRHWFFIISKPVSILADSIRNWSLFHKTVILLLRNTIVGRGGYTALFSHYFFQKYYNGYR